LCIFNEECDLWVDEGLYSCDCQMKDIMIGWGCDYWCLGSYCL